MKAMRRLWKILKAAYVDKILVGFLFFVFGMSAVFAFVEPGIKTYGDGLWYAFSVITTIGFGDYYAVTFLGRVCTMILGVYGLLIVALIPGVMVSYYMEFIQSRADESVSIFLEKLENLDKLSKEELRELSEKVKNRKNKRSK